MTGQCLVSHDGQEFLWEVRKGHHQLLGGQVLDKGREKDELSSGVGLKREQLLSKLQEDTTTAICKDGRN